MLLHVLHAKVDVRLLDPLGAPSSKFEAVQRVLTEQSYSSDSSSSPTSSSQASMRFKTLDKTPVKLSVSVMKFPIKVSIVFHNLKFFFQDDVNGYIPSPSRVTDTNTFKKLQEVVKAVREGPTSLPSTILYRVNNSFSNIQCATLSTDASMLVTGCQDSSLISWDLLPPSTPRQSTNPNEVILSTNSNTNNDPSTIRLGCDDTPDDDNDTNSQDLKAKTILRGHSGPIYDTAFMPRSNYVLSVSEDTTMRLWDLQSGLNRAIYQGHSYPIWSVDSDRVGVNIVTG